MRVFTRVHLIEGTGILSSASVVRVRFIRDYLGTISQAKQTDRTNPGFRGHCCQDLGPSEFAIAMC